MPVIISLLKVSLLTGVMQYRSSGVTAPYSTRRIPLVPARIALVAGARHGAYGCVLARCLSPVGKRVAVLPFF
ncbi:hypothetical protein ACO0LB_15180 [Undibacterium sp. SXout7W]|uniref:hypothetical protein n=1 Tax=Undibacterium sp. SXout7W TaxID=3413049 RepID=UPI003BF2422B